MPRKRFTICGREFPSKKAVLEYVRTEIHQRYPDFGALSKEHLTFMVELLRHHPWSDQKIGCGILRMWIEPNVKFPTRGFWLERIDGTKTDFSFYQCVESASPLRDFREACRRAVAPIIIDFRHSFFRKFPDAHCEITGEAISLHNSHVDHAPPETFERIVECFLISRGLIAEEAPITDHTDGRIGVEFFRRCVRG